MYLELALCISDQCLRYVCYYRQVLSLRLNGIQSICTVSTLS